MNNDVSRINAFITNKNYERVNKLMKEERILGMKLSKGAILDLALTNLHNSLENGVSLTSIAEAMLNEK